MCGHAGVHLRAVAISSSVWTLQTRSSVHTAVIQYSSFLFHCNQLFCLLQITMRRVRILFIDCAFDNWCNE